jgi:hypothetical protein
MTILEQAINCDDGDRAARIIMAAWYRIRRGGELTASPSTGQRIASSAPPSLATGSKRRRNS